VAVDQIVALAPGEIQPIPFATIEREPGDVQRLSLGARLLAPIIATTGRIAAVAYLGDNALQADSAGVLEHRGAVDFEALAKLDGGWPPTACSIFR
jgi:hypothetical protein